MPGCGACGAGIRARAGQVCCHVLWVSPRLQPRAPATATMGPHTSPAPRPARPRVPCPRSAAWPPLKHSGVPHVLWSGHPSLSPTPSSSARLLLSPGCVSPAPTTVPGPRQVPSNCFSQKQLEAVPSAGRVPPTAYTPAPSYSPF